MMLRKLLFLLLISMLIPWSSQSATLNVVGGQLVGASGVIVDGNSYDVEFLDGTCIDLYNGCDSVSDFTFQTSAAAVLASQALLDQVFLDGAFLFDTDPELTNGCISTIGCHAWTPFAVDVQVDLASAGNFTDFADDVYFFSLFPSTNITGFGGYVYAVWSPVPEPGTALLMGLGLLGLSARKRHEG